MPSESARPYRHLERFLYAVFFFSGFASLIYQVVWQRMLTLHYGVGTLSITLIVSVYMLGLGLGAYFGGRLAEQGRNNVRLYFIIELLLGIFGALSLPFLDAIGQATAGSSYGVSLLCMFAFLFAPTFLMGMTLPLLTKIFSRCISSFLDNLSALYFINTLGAALGAILTSYLLISFFGMAAAVYTAVALNILLAAAIAFAEKKWPQAQVQAAAPPEEESKEHFGKYVFLFVFVSGFLAIAYEIAWFRLCSVMIKSSVYAFSTILAVYLLGVALGSRGMKRRLAKNKKIEGKQLFFRLQGGIGLYVALSIIAWYWLTAHTPLSVATKASFGFENHPPLHFDLSSAKQIFVTLYTSFDIVLWPLFFAFVPAYLMGACFPLIASLSKKGSGKEGETVGRAYFVNVGGNVLGGIVTGLLLLPLLGTEYTLLLLAGGNLLFFFGLRNFRGRELSLRARFAFLLPALALLILLFPKKGQAWDTMHIIADKEAYDSYYEEGLDGVTATFVEGENVRNFINGLAHGGRPASGFHFMTIEGLSCAQQNGEVLVIGYGTGSVVEAALKSPEVKKVTCVELSETLMDNLRKIELFQKLLSDPRLELVIDDGRRYLLAHPEKRYDAILIDPIRSATAYSNNLYSQEFFALAKTHLSPGGIFLFWRDEHKVLLRTAASVFPEMRVYKEFSICSGNPLQGDTLRRRRMIDSFTPENRVGLNGRIGKTYLGDRGMVEKATAGAAINTDLRPACEYYLGNHRGDEPLRPE